MSARMESALHRSVSIDRIVRCIFPRRQAVHEQLELRTALLSPPLLPLLGAYPWQIEEGMTTMTTNGDGFLQPRPTPLARSLDMEPFAVA